MDYSTSWSRSAGRSSDIQGSLLLTHAGLLLLGAWATLAVAPLHELSDERPPIALEAYADACHAGDSVACNDLGVSYQRGYGTEPDAAAAAELFERACRAGSADACSNQGALLEQGWAAGEDIAPIVSAYERACDRGSALGCSNLGALHARGKGLPLDPPRARWFFERACRMGSAIGCENLLAARVDIPRPHAPSPPPSR